MLGTFSCNFINFQGSEGDTTSGELDDPLDQSAVNRQTFELDQTITASPEIAKVGKTLAISLFDWPEGAITRISIGGNNVKAEDLVGLPPVPVSGEVSFNFVIPGTLANDIQVPLGKVPFKVFAGGENEDTNITIKE